MDSRAAEQIERMKGVVASSLQLLKSFGAAREELLTEGSIVRAAFPHIVKLLPLIELLESRTEPVDWENLESWIDAAFQKLRDESNTLASCFETMGLPPSDAYIDQDTTHAAKYEMIENSPLAQIARRAYGSAWLTRIDQLKLLMPVSQMNMPAPDIRKLLMERVNAILGCWEKLKRFEINQELNDFEKCWRQLSASTRRTWLMKHFHDLPERPHPEIYAYVSSAKKMKANVFMTPLLNVDDLSQDSVLPRLLKKRAEVHPRVFRTIDGSAIALGTFGGYLKLRAHGKLDFSGQDVNEQNPYGVSFHDHFDELQPAGGVNAGIGVQQLEAQLRMYKFISACPEKLSISVGALESEAAPFVPSEGLSLLNQCSRLDYDGPPLQLDLKHPRELIDASLNDALEDLWQLRTDAEYWNARLHEMPAKSNKHTENILRTVYFRVNIFQALALRLQDLQQSLEIDDDTQPQPQQLDLPALLSAFHGCLEEYLSHLRELHWKPARSPDDDVLAKLYQLVTVNDPTVWIMGLPKVMRVIDKELRAAEAIQDVPFVVTQALNDTSVLAVCVRQIWSFYQTDSSILEENDRLNELEATWSRRPRPWMSVADQVLGGDKSRKLGAFVRDEHESLETRHHSFWNMLDESTKEICHSPEMLDVAISIQNNAPLPDRPAQGCQPSMPWINHATSSGPTATQVKRATHGRKKQPRQSQVEPFTAHKVERQLLPTVTPSRNLDSWRTLVALSHENHSKLSWIDFCQAMGGIGYTIFSQVGAAFRFEHCELPTFVFHAPHRGRRSKAEFGLIKKAWRARLLRHLNIVVPDAAEDVS